MRRRQGDQISGQEELPVFGLANIFPADEPRTEQIGQVPHGIEGQVVSSVPEAINGYQEVLANKAATDSFGLGYAFELPSWFRVVDPPAVARPLDKDQDAVSNTERYLDPSYINQAVENGEIRLTILSKNFKVNMPGYGALPLGYGQDYKLDFRVKTEVGFKPGSMELRRLKFLSDDEEPGNLKYKKVYWVMQPTIGNETLSLSALQKEAKFRSSGLVLPQVRRGDNIANTAAVVTRREQVHRTPIDEIKDRAVVEIADRVLEVEPKRVPKPVVDFTRSWQEAVGVTAPPAAVEAETVAGIATSKPESESAPKANWPTTNIPAVEMAQQSAVESKDTARAAKQGEQSLKGFLESHKHAGNSGITPKRRRKSLWRKFSEAPRLLKYGALAGVAGVLAVGVTIQSGGSEFSGDQIGVDLSKAELSQLISRHATPKEKQAAVKFAGELANGDFATTSFYEADGKLALEVNYKNNWFPQGTYDDAASYAKLARNYYLQVDGKFKLTTEDIPNAFGVYPSSQKPGQLVVVADLSRFVTEPADTGEDPKTKQSKTFSTVYGKALTKKESTALVTEIADHPLYGVFSVADTSEAVTMLHQEGMSAKAALLGRYAVLLQIKGHYGSSITTATEKAVQSFIAKAAKANHETVSNVEFINTKKRPSALSNFMNGHDLEAYTGDDSVARFKDSKVSSANTRLVGIDELKLSKAK